MHSIIYEKLRNSKSKIIIVSVFLPNDQRQTYSIPYIVVLEGNTCHIRILELELKNRSAIKLKLS